MSRVEENKTVVESTQSSIESVGGESLATMMLHDSGLMSNIIGMAALDILVDISKSLAMMADDLHYYRQYESEVIERGINNA